MISLPRRPYRLTVPKLHSTPSPTSPRRRVFNSKSTLLLLARPSVRPQLHFLYAPFGARSKALASRFISTEQKKRFKYQVQLGIYWSLIGWTLFGGVSISYLIFREDWLDRLYPSPSEWYYFTKTFWRRAKHEIETDGHSTGVINWARAGSNFRSTVLFLEDFRVFNIHRPSGIQFQHDWDHSIPGIDPELMRAPPDPVAGKDVWPNRIGYDITMKSEPWRRGYYEAMMGLCKAAEVRDGYLAHKQTKVSFPPELVRSPSNPYPKPPPPGSGLETPDIEDCEATFETPDFHYVRLLTTKGFSREQRMDAGLAYAMWLDRCGHTATAESLYRWCMGLALDGVSQPRVIVNPDTGVISAKAPYVTGNILTTSEALASFRARTGHISAALNIYLSTLRARRAAPQAPLGRQYPPRPPDLSLKSIDSVVRWLTSLFNQPAFAPPPPSGDEPYERKASEECEEAALMAYVGEILFAKTARRKEGLAWTNNATEIAEKRLQDPRLNGKGIKTCQQCFQTGLGNLKNMAGQLAREKEQSTKNSQSSLGGWFFGEGREDRLLAEKDWAVEEEANRDRQARFEEQQLNARLNSMISSNSSWSVT